MTSPAAQLNIRPLAKPAVDRRIRWGVLVGVGIVLALTAYVAIVAGPASDTTRMTAVLKATKDIHLGTQITADELAVAYVHPQDSALLSTWVQPSDRARLVGQTATVTVPAGSLLPATLVAPQVSAGFWEINIKVNGMPSDLKAGDHVALMVQGTTASGSPVDLVYMQDVEILNLSGGGADLWLPTKYIPQIHYYSEHGGITLIKMQPGSVANVVPPGGGS